MPNATASIKNFYISELSRSPRGVTRSSADDTADEKEDDDWRVFFNSQPEEDVQERSGTEGRASELSTHEALHSLQSHRSQFSAAWLAVLHHVKKSPDQSSRVLSILHRSILPHFLQPIQLMDWISACVDFGESMIFHAGHVFNISRWVYLTSGLQCTVRIDSRSQPVGLVVSNCDWRVIYFSSDYPDFYLRLYAVLDRNILHVKYRARFFRLLELFLSSTSVAFRLLLKPFHVNLCSIVTCLRPFSRHLSKGSLAFHSPRLLRPL
jgi:U3 small nucleolar RNA-associated protein 19